MESRKFFLFLAIATLFFIVAPYLTTKVTWRNIVSVNDVIPECAKPNPNADDAEICKLRYNMKMKEYRAAKFKYNTEHTASVFYWQRISTTASFFVLIFLVTAGVIFAMIEFNKGKGGETTFKISKDGVEISSEIIGLIILAMSLVFAYVYIDKIYPINSEKSNIEQSKPASD